MAKVIAADIGGSHITSALVDLETRQLDHTTISREGIGAYASPEEVIECWSRSITHAGCMKLANVLCLAVPGPFDYQGGTCLIKDQAKYPGLYGKNVKELLSQKLKLPVSSIAMENDAACFIRGEVFSGSVTGMNRVVAITLGTGLGSAAYNNRVARDADLWRSPFRDGIAEDYISSRWFVKRFEELTGQQVPGVKQLVEEGKSDVVDHIFDEFANNLASFLEDFIKRENAEAIVIGGNIAKAFDRFAPVLKTRLPHVVIKKSVLGEHAALLGAASCWHS